VLDGRPDTLLASIRRRRPDADPAALVPVGWDGARRLIEQYVAAGLSKFVVRPAAAFPAGNGSFAAFTEAFVRELVPLQN
jgi:8-oxo-dGTP pyrophosphatase MutT (NUDIX family)